jgi:hypothetical protein
MKKTLFIVFRILIAIVLIGKMSNWFLNYSDETNQVLNASMFTLIGIAYVVAGYVWDTKLIKIIFLISGLYLMVISFVNDFYLKPILGIACILTPMLLVRFSPEEPDENELAEN